MNTNVQISIDVLNKCPGRALTFLSGISRNAEIRALLIPYGYTDAVHEEGWRLLNKTGGRARPTSPVATEAPVDVAGAEGELGVWATRTFSLASASLRHNFPAQHDYLFEGDLKPQQGKGAVLSVSTFLTRLDGLASDPARAASRDEDRAALDRLDERSVTPSERTRAASLIAVIEAGAVMVAPPEAPKAARDHEAAKVALYQWFDEWSDIAHVAITRRDLLIRIGLASPRSRKAAKADAKEPAKSEVKVETKVETKEEPKVTAPLRTVPPGRPSAMPMPASPN
jgi:hypothetical protein